MGVSRPRAAASPGGELHPVARAPYAHPVPRRSLVLLCAGLAALNLALNLAQYVGYQEGPVRFDAEVGRLARSLLTNGTFADPFGAAPTGPSAHTPPLFPLIYAAYVALLGESSGAWVAIKLAGGLALSLWVGLLPFVSQRWGMSVAPGVVGAVLAIVSALRHFPEWDANYAALSLIVLGIVAAPRLWCDDTHGAETNVALITRQSQPTQPTQRTRAGSSDADRSSSAPTASGSPRDEGWAVGFLWALAMHLNAVALLLFVLWAVALVWRARRSGRVVPWAGAIVLPLLLLLPWTMRNWVVLGSPIVLRGNLGLELAVANADCAAPGLLQNLASGCFAAVHPDGSPVEAERMRTLGEPAYHADRMAEARAWVAEHPHRFARLTARRFALFWFPSPLDDWSRDWWESTPPRRARVVWVSTVLMVIGLLALAKQAFAGAERAATLVVPLFVVSALYAPVQFEDRYRYPILWITFLLAGYALTNVWAWLRARLTS